MIPRKDRIQAYARRTTPSESSHRNNKIADKEVLSRKNTIITKFQTE
jgi:hypothetical protein